MNKTITEDYVSYKVALLLKEKGFDIECNHAYYNRRLVDYTLYGFCDGELVNCPTHQMAMKWLREDHKWSIQVFPVFDNLKWCYDIYELKIQKYQSRPELLSDMDYDTYEDACEAAIRYCLMNLIK